MSNARGLASLYSSHSPTPVGATIVNHRSLFSTCTLALLLAVSGCASKPAPPPQPPVVLSQAAWQQVDWDIMGACEGASRSAQDYARRSMRVWKDAV